MNFFAPLFSDLRRLATAAFRTRSTALRQGEDRHRIAATDELTGVASRHHLLEIGSGEVSRARRYGRPLSVLILDIDHLKTLNDTWGRPTGDRALQALTNVATSAVREHDTMGRVGGEEFAIVLQEADQAGALAIAERLRIAIQDFATFTTDDGRLINLTVSIGAATLGLDETTFEALLARADKAVCQAKEKGRNRAVVAWDRPATKELSS